jgi:DeoR/GlpR family transcriptional regulator of sugar metabolism
MSLPCEQPMAESKAEKRRVEIVRVLMENGTVQIKELTRKLNVSLMTIHRDLNELEGQGLLRRIRGVVTAEKSMLIESSYEYRARQKIDQKRRLAKAALRHIEPGNAIIWDDSSTTFHATEFINEVTPVTVITNALPVMEKLCKMPDIDLIGLGGKFNRAYMGFFGMACEMAIRTLHVDVALLSSTTIQGLSIYTQDEQVVRAKQAMIKVARKKLLLVDETKFHFSALNFVADLRDFDVVLLTGDIEASVIDKLRSAGVNVELV